MRYEEKTSARGRLRFGGLLLAATLMMSWSRGGAADTLGAVSSPRDALASTAAIIEGSVTEVSYTYDAAAGPRTVVTLQSLTTHLGRYSGRTLEVATLGGPIDGRRWLFIPELPQLTEDTRYLLFLTNVDWFYNPVVAEYAFRLEPGPRGGEVLIDPAGHAVLGVSADGLEISSDPVVDMQIDFLTPNAKPRLLEGASTLLADAMSKDDFLAAIRDLARATPPQGDYRIAPARDRVWNRTATAEE
jgi:hypothetical protein